MFYANDHDDVDEGDKVKDEKSTFKIKWSWRSLLLASNIPSFEFSLNQLIPSLFLS